MKLFVRTFLFLTAIFLVLTGQVIGQEGIAVIINHNCCHLDQIPTEAIEAAKSSLHIAYGHTSHGSQLITGMSGLVGFINGGGLGLDYPDDFFAFNNDGTDGALDLRDTPFTGASDLGNPDRTSWAAATRNYLSENKDINVSIWSWCGQVSSASSEDIVTYVSLMDSLETDYPDVKFVYMTGHLDGSGEEGNLHQRNEQIRNYCRENGKILYDFADIESYDPDGNCYVDKFADDNCDYDSDGDEIEDSNWAENWQAGHTEGVDWYSCSAAHSKPLNGNLKAYAAWWLWATLAGWDQVVDIDNPLKPLPDQFELFQNFPNPFNASTQIAYFIPERASVCMVIYDLTGKKVEILIDKVQQKGLHQIDFNANRLASGIYFYKLVLNNQKSEIKKMFYLK